MKDIITACQNAKVFVAAPDHPIEHMLSKTEPILPKLKMIGLFDRDRPFQVRDDKQIRSSLRITGEEHDSRAEISVVFTFSASASKKIRWMLDVIESLARPISLHLIDSGPVGKKPTIEISSLMTLGITRLCFYQSCFLFTRDCISVCRDLTHLVFTGHGKDINKSILTALCRAMDDHHLPELYHLSLSGCESSLKGQMQHLFAKSWPSLTQLDVTKCVLNEQDIGIICAAADNNLGQNSLPNLSSLAISPKYIEVNQKFEFLKKPWDELKSLEMSRGEPSSMPGQQKLKDKAYEVFMNALTEGMFPKLEQLAAAECLPKQFKELKYLKSLKLSNGRSRYDRILLDVKQLSEEFPVFNLEQIDLSDSQLSSNLAHLFCQTFPRLESLILRSCGLPPDSGSSLAQANAYGRFPKLKQLDLSGNSCTSTNLFEINTTWKELQILRTSENFGFWAETFQKIAEMVYSGYLPKLEELHANKYEQYLDDSECPRCGLPSKAVLRKRIEEECRYRYTGVQYTGCNVTLKDLLVPIVDNLPMIKSSSFEAIYFYSRNFFPFELEGAQVEKQEIRSKNITTDFIKQW